ncbi:uncharacterized protein LOC128642224 [Bombina bombina]|uniref:uncharacterized protein LOC128642224 n=1 Tax=Bombina bombina TaxID=8345 RepID=UPI00235A8E69|nr:uncharacterized protein LOC128642224 [Bombina bombina]
MSWSWFWGSLCSAQNTGARAPGEYSSSRAPGEYLPSRAPGEYSSSRAPRQYSPRRAPGEYSPRRAPGEYSSSRAPGQYSPRRAPGEYSPRRAPGDYSSSTAPGEYSSSRAPGEYSPSRAPGQYLPSRAPGEYSPSRAPGEYAPRRAPGEYAPSRAPGEYSPSRAPGEYSPSRALGQPVGITSRCSEDKLKWLIDLLKSACFSGLVSEVRYLYISNRNSNEWRKEITNCSLVILYHSKHHGRINSTDIDGALYDEQLLYLSQMLGLNKVMVVLDDVDQTGEDERQRILRTQPSIRLYSCMLILIPQKQKEEALLEKYGINVPALIREALVQQPEMSARYPPIGNKGSLRNRRPLQVVHAHNLVTSDKNPPEGNRCLSQNRRSPETTAAHKPASPSPSHPSRSTYKISNDIESDCYTLKSEPFTKYQNGTSHRKHTVCICSRSAMSNYHWLMSHLQAPGFTDLVQVVRSVYISNDFSRFASNLQGCTFAILYHTLNHGRLNISDVTDSLYDRELQHLYLTLGKDNVIVVVDDLNDSSKDNKMRILKEQPTIGTCAKEMFLISGQEKKYINNSYSSPRSIKGKRLHHTMMEIEEIIKMSSKFTDADTTDCTGSRSMLHFTLGKVKISVAAPLEEFSDHPGLKHMKTPNTAQEACNISNDIESDCYTLKSEPFTKYQNGTSHRKHTVCICSRSAMSNYHWLMSHLQAPGFTDLVQVVRNVYISNDFSRFASNLQGCTFAILYHTLNHGRLNISDVTDSLYDCELQHLYLTLGKDNVIVVVDDLNDSSKDNKMRILKEQPTIRTCAKEMFLISGQEKKYINNSYSSSRSIKVKRLRHTMMEIEEIIKMSSVMKTSVPAKPEEFTGPPKSKHQKTIYTEHTECNVPHFCESEPLSEDKAADEEICHVPLTSHMPMTSHVPLTSHMPMTSHVPLTSHVPMTSHSVRSSSLKSLNHKVIIFSNHKQIYCQWLLNELQAQHFADEVVEVTYFDMSNIIQHDLQSFECSFAILYHAHKYGGNNIIGLDKSINQILKNNIYKTCKLGKENTVLVIDDLEKSSDDVKTRIWKDHPGINRWFGELFLFSENEKHGKSKPERLKLLGIVKRMKENTERKRTCVTKEDTKCVTSEHPELPNSESMSRVKKSKGDIQTILCKGHPQKHKIIIFSKSPSRKCQWLKSFLQGPRFANLVEDVCISANYSHAHKSSEFTFGILYHTHKHGHINISDLLHDRELEDLSRKLGKDNVIMVIDNLETISEEVKRRISNNKPIIERLAREAFFFSEKEKSLIESYSSGYLYNDRRMKDKLQRIEDIFKTSCQKHQESTRKVDNPATPSSAYQRVSRKHQSHGEYIQGLKSAASQNGYLLQETEVAPKGRLNTMTEEHNRTEEREKPKTTAKEKWNPHPSTKLETSSRTGNVDWCTCSNCIVMTTEVESKCCNEIEKIHPWLRSGMPCVCRHQYINRLIDREYLQDLHRYSAAYKELKLLDAKDLQERDYRRIAYRAFTLWLYGGYIGPKNCRPIPSCVVRTIRHQYPTTNKGCVGSLTTECDGPAEEMFLD